MSAPAPFVRAVLRGDVDKALLCYAWQHYATWRGEHPGEVAAGDCLTLLDRPHAAFSVARLLALIRDRVTDPAQIEPVLRLPLPPSWQRLFEQRLTMRQAEDWVQRLKGST